MSIRKSLKITKWYSKVVNRRRTHYIQWPNEKGEKDKYLSTIHYAESYIGQHESDKNLVEIKCSAKIRSSYFTSVT